MPYAYANQAHKSDPTEWHARMVLICTRQYPHINQTAKNYRHRRKQIHLFRGTITLMMPPVTLMPSDNGVTSTKTSSAFLLVPGTTSISLLRMLAYA